MEKWTSHQELIFLKDQTDILPLLEFLKCEHLSILNVYCDFIFKHFDILSDTDKICHMLFVKKHLETSERKKKEKCIPYKNTDIEEKRKTNRWLGKTDENRKRNTWLRNRNWDNFEESQRFTFLARERWQTIVSESLQLSWFFSNCIQGYVEWPLISVFVINILTVAVMNIYQA